MNTELVSLIRDLQIQKNVNAEQPLRVYAKLLNNDENEVFTYVRENSELLKEMLFDIVYIEQGVMEECYLIK
jgi:hypothetical protein